MPDGAESEKKERSHKLVYGGIFLIFAVLAAYFAYFPKKEPVSGEVAVINEGRPEAMQVTFSNPKKSAHYESNTPAHGAIFPVPPISIVIDFNFDLAAPSMISATKDGKEYATGETQIDGNRLAMRRAFDAAAPDGLYLVNYNACWPDGSCHDGNFQFAIDRSRTEGYVDMTGQKEVLVDMQNILFNPANIIVSPGTKVTWIQKESIEHFVNTETHPAHTYFPPQNSRGLKLNDTFSAVFEKPGLYPYHCSAHAAVMKGNILVR